MAQYKYQGPTTDAIMDSFSGWDLLDNTKTAAQILAEKAPIKKTMGKALPEEEIKAPTIVSTKKDFDYFTLEAKPAEEKASISAGYTPLSEEVAEKVVEGAPAGASSEAVQKAIDWAKAQVGKGYLYGSKDIANGGLDCSGLVYQAYKQAGIDVPMSTQAWLQSGKATITLDDLQAGDLVVMKSNSSGSGRHIVMATSGKNADGTFSAVHAKGKDYGIVANDHYKPGEILGIYRAKQGGKIKMASAGSRIYDENKNVVLVPTTLTAAQKEGKEPFKYGSKRYYLENGGKCISWTSKHKIQKAALGASIDGPTPFHASSLALRGQGYQMQNVMPISSAEEFDYSDLKAKASPAAPATTLGEYHLLDEEPEPAAAQATVQKGAEAAEDLQDWLQKYEPLVPQAYTQRAMTALGILQEKLGLTPAQAAGIAGVMISENGINPASYNKAEKDGSWAKTHSTAAAGANDGRGYGAGIGSWTFNKTKERIKGYLRQIAGQDRGEIENYSLEEQLGAYCQDLLAHPAILNRLKQAATVDEAAEIVTLGIENGGMSGNLASKEWFDRAYTWTKGTDFDGNPYNNHYEAAMHNVNRKYAIGRAINSRYILAKYLNSQQA